MMKRCADSLSETVGKIKDKIIGSAPGHFDETGTRVNKKLCCAHLLRELTGIDENHPGQKRASAFIDLLLEMKKVKDKAVEKGKDSLSYYHYHKFDKKYDELIEQARKENPLPETTEKKRGRKKKGKIMSYVGTAHKQGYNAYEAIKKAFDGARSDAFYISENGKKRKMNTKIIEFIADNVVYCTLDKYKY